MHEEVNLYALYVASDEKGDINMSEIISNEFSKAGTLKFKVSSFRKIPNPYINSENSGEKKPEMYMIICDVKNIPNDIPMKTNPREQKLTTNVANKIRESLTNHSELNFYLLNRGLLLSAKSITYDNVTSMVSIDFEDLDVHGDVDGGHTYKIIKENSKLLDYGEQYCKIEVLTGVEDMFEQLAAARNTSVQVKDKSIAELEKRFELIKSAFVAESFSNDINYKENDTKRIDVQDILSILYLFNIDKYPNDNTGSFPIQSYSSKKVCTDSYINASKEFENDQTKNPYVKMKPIMVDIMKLYDKLECEIGDYYKDQAGKKYGSTKGVSTHQDGKPDYKSKFYQNTIRYISPLGFLYPIIGAFRSLVYETPEGVYAWKKNPFDILEKTGASLVNDIVDRSRELGNNPNATGKSAPTWKNAYMLVKMESMMG